MFTIRNGILVINLISLAAMGLVEVPAQSTDERTISGVVVTRRNEAVAGAVVTATYPSGRQEITTDRDGKFSARVPREEVQLSVDGKYIVPTSIYVGPSDPADLQIQIEYVVPPVHESIVIAASPVDPVIDRRNAAVYNDTLFSRDDQIFHTLDAGINAGQHEGGGKSLEVRRFGFNLDHGGVSGGLKVLVDNIQQNHATQGHGQGYLGQLKSLIPELVSEVDILNGPFTAEYGDFSGLGVVHIRLKESLTETLMLRLQGGSFDSFRTFIGYGPDLKNANAYAAYEGSRTDGPFENPLGYRRDNFSANYTLLLGERKALGFKLSAGRNDFTSSGQIPLDEVEAGGLDRFGFVDPDNGGRGRAITGAVYFRREGRADDLLKIDGFVTRSLFDLYSNFTFFLKDEVNGDEIQQHDSRLQEGANIQYLRPIKAGTVRGVFVAGGNFHDNRVSLRSCGWSYIPVAGQLTFGFWSHLQNYQVVAYEGGVRSLRC